MNDSEVEEHRIESGEEFLPITAKVLPGYLVKPGRLGTWVRSVFNLFNSIIIKSIYL